MAKSLVLSVSLWTGCYRHIQIGEGATLSALSNAILGAVGFDDDHLSSFFMNNRAWDEEAEFVCPRGYLDNAQGFTDEVELSQFSLAKGDKFMYLYDYGDEWRFQIKVLRVIDGPTAWPVILKSVGQVSQYDDNDDEDWYGFVDDDEDDGDGDDEDDDNNDIV